MPFWHAPALVYWGGQTVGKSLFFSTVACWRNKGAFAVYALDWLGHRDGSRWRAQLVFAVLGQPHRALVRAGRADLHDRVLRVALFTFADCFDPCRRAGAREGSTP